MHLNHVCLIGTVCKDPDLRFVGASRVPVTDLRLAINRFWKTDKGEKKTDTVFLDVTVWAKSAELCIQYLRKGRLVCAEGRLTMSEWVDREGRAQSRIRVTAERVIFLPDGRGERAESTAPESGGELPALPEPQAEPESEARLPA
jgi:single-strand DNA-binding protein